MDSPHRTPYQGIANKLLFGKKIMNQKTQRVICDPTGTHVFWGDSMPKACWDRQLEHYGQRTGEWKGSHPCSSAGVSSTDVGGRVIRMISYSVPDSDPRRI